MTGDGAALTPGDSVSPVRARAPLFLPALAFAAGAVGGGTLPLPLLPLAALAACSGTAWLLVAGIPRLRELKAVSLGLFLLACLAGAALHARLPLAHPPPDALRSLPDSKFLNPQWEGRIVSAPDFTPSKQPADIAQGLGRARFTFGAERWRESPYASWQPAEGLVDVTLEGVADQWASGQTLHLGGPLQLPSPASGPGTFDSRAYLASHGIFYRLRLPASSAQVLAPARGFQIAPLAEKAREWSVAQLRKGIEDDPAVAAILSGMVLGQKETVSPWTLSEFRTTGTYHLFAVSGSNLVLLAGLLLGALRLAGLLSWRWGWLAIPLLYLYVVTTGNQASIVRAFLASAALYAAWRIGRPASPLNFWSLTLLGLLAIRPEAALDLGFQLSFAIVLCLILFAFPLGRLFERPFGLDPFIPLRYATKRQQAVEHANRTLATLLAASLVAWLGAAGLELLYFHQVCLVSIPANAIAVPLGGLIFTVGFLTLLFAPFSSVFAGLLNNANWLFVKALLLWVGFMAHLPHASHYVAPWGDDPGTRIVFTKSGYGTAALVQSGGKTWLLNPGNEKGYFYGPDPVRKYYGVNRLDGVFLTQWNAPQGAVLPRLPELFAGLPDVLFAPPPPPVRRKAPEWIAALRDDRRLRIVGNGERIDLGGGLKATVLAPSSEHPPSGAAADRGLVLLFERDGSRLLYAGAVGIATEKLLLSYLPPEVLQASVLVQSRPERDFLLDPEWLAAVAPRDVIHISAAGREANEKQEENGPRIWNRTDAEEGTGTVIVTFPGDGKSPEVQTWRAPERRE